VRYLDIFGPKYCAETYNPLSPGNLHSHGTLIEVWRQALVENAKVVELSAERYSVKQSPTSTLWVVARHCR
jgi:hypothetical protein